MEKPIISVIIPVHNGDEFIENCIQSVLAQTYPQVEIIIVENGSTDGTTGKCDLLEREHSEVTVYHIPACGVSAARNYGIDRSHGAYLTFVDADDQLEQGMLEKLYAVAQRDGSDIAGCEFREDRKESEQCLSGRAFAEQRIFYGDSRCWSKLYSREVIGEIRYPVDLTIGEDMIFLLKLVLQPKVKVSCIPYKGYCYYVNPQGAMQRDFTPSFMDQIKCWSMAKQMLENPSEQLLRQMNSLILTAVVLVAQKLARLTGTQRFENRSCIESCLEEVKKLKNQDKAAYRKAVKAMNGKHRIELWLFCHVPEGYLWLRRRLA